MRLDRWFKRRFPALALSHLAKICRKGEVRVDGKRVDTSTRLEENQKIRVPPLKIEAPAAPAVTARRPRGRPRARRDDAVRGQGSARPEQALWPRRAGRLRHDAAYRRHAGIARRRAIRGRCWCIGSTATPPACCSIAKNRRTAADLGEIFRSRQAQENLLGAGRRRAEAGAGPRLALSRQGRRYGRRTLRRRRRAPRDDDARRKCASPGMARPTRSTR